MFPNYCRYAKVRLYYRWKGMKRFSYYSGLLANERRSSQEIHSVQWTKLTSLLEHAYQTVPYYRRLFEQVGMHPKDVRSTEDFARFPVLTKDAIRRHRDEILSQTAAPDSYFLHSTSGSTAQPISFYRGWDYNEYANTAGGYRSFHRAGWRPGEKLFMVWGPPLERLEWPKTTLGKLRRTLGEWARDTGDLVCSAFDATPEKMAEWVRTFRHKRPHYIYGYTSALATFGRYLEKEGIRLSNIRGVISTAETLYPEQRELFQRVFGGIVIDQYGSREVCSIAASCIHGNMHINSDLVYVEFVDFPGNPAIKKILVTDLENRIFPFLRYDIGDIGAPSVTNCCCGLPFPVMQMKLGRVSDNFLSPEGRIVHGNFFKHLMDNIPGIAEFQFRQVQEDKIVLSLKQSEKFGPETEEYLKKVHVWVKRDFSERAQLLIQYVDCIPRTEMGKYRYTICELDTFTGRLTPEPRIVQ